MPRAASRSILSLAPHHGRCVTHLRQRPCNGGSAFITESIDAGRGVYIHCGAGVGRLPTMAAACLVHRGATMKAAWETLRRARRSSGPTPPQVKAIAALAGAALAAADAAQVPVAGKQAGALTHAPSVETARSA